MISCLTNLNFKDLKVKHNSQHFRKVHRILKTKTKTKFSPKKLSIFSKFLFYFAICCFTCLKLNNAPIFFTKKLLQILLHNKYKILSSVQFQKQQNTQKKISVKAKFFI